jgi:sugar (pentulose or hexulose) kinase
VSGRYFIGVDSGSQSTKVSIIDDRGTPVCSVTEPLQPTISRQVGWVEHPDDDLWRTLTRALRTLFARFEGDPSEILALGLCSIRCCRVFMKPDGTLAEPVMSWMDVRAYETFEDDPSIGYTGSTSGYLTHRLTGELTDTIANSLQDQFPIDVHTWRWSEDSDHFDSFRIPREKLLEMKLPGQIVGHVTGEVAAKTGLPAGLPVVATANDKAVEALGSGLIEPGAGLLSLGTYIAAMVYGTEYRDATDSFFTNLSSVPYRYVYESAGIRGGMWHLSWLKGIIGGELLEQADRDGVPVEELLEPEAAAVQPGSEGLLIATDWLSSADQLHKKGIMVGFDQRHTRGHIYRALMEAIAMRMKNNFDDMNRELGQEPEELIVCGGGSNSDLFMQIVADTFGVTAVRNVINGAAALGAAICAAVGSGHYGGFDEAVANMVHRRDEFRYDPRTHGIYSHINDRAYRHLTSMLEDTLRTIHETYKAV